MYCPQCGTENLANASFCRGCGANISLVPQALTGSLPAAASPEELDDDDDYSYGRRRRRRGRKGPPSIEKGIKNIFMGVAFVLVAVAVALFARGGGGWWYWMLIPAFTMLGGGVAEVVRFKLEKNPALPAAPVPAALPLATPRPTALPRRNTAELIPQPPSVTEGTTRHLDGELPTRHLETPVESGPKNV